MVGETYRAALVPAAEATAVREMLADELETERLRSGRKARPLAVFSDAAGKAHEVWAVSVASRRLVYDLVDGWPALLLGELRNLDDDATALVREYVEQAKQTNRPLARAVVVSDLSGAGAASAGETEEDHGLGTGASGQTALALG